jgi:sugar phosphate isomerase/epimerase
MNGYSANIDDFSLDSRCLAGSLAGKLAVARAAGFNQIMLASAELASHPQGLETALAEVRTSGLRISGFQSLTDFEGLSGPLQTHKIDIAKAMLEMCHALPCHLLVVSASTLAQSSSDTASLLRNLRQLAMLAIPGNIKIAYRAQPNARLVRDFGQAWDLVCQADMPNLGLCLDAAPLLDSAGLQDDLEMLDAEKLFLVQLADQIDAGSPGSALFPGEGQHSAQLAHIVTTLHELGYRGDYALAVHNPDDQNLPAPCVAQRAWQSALWLGQDVLQRSVPLPNQIRLKRAQNL